MVAPVALSFVHSALYWPRFDGIEALESRGESDPAAPGLIFGLERALVRRLQRSK
jgi:hypothetical protein